MLDDAELVSEVVFAAVAVVAVEVAVAPDVVVAAAVPEMVVSEPSAALVAVEPLPLAAVEDESDPLCMVTASEYAIAPVLSLSSKEMEVPAAMSTVHVMEVSFVESKVLSAVLEVSPPGMMER